MASHDDMPDEELWALSRSDDPSERADAQMELASRAKARQDWMMSKNLYGSALDIYLDLEMDADIGRATYGLGYCQYRLRDYAEAVESLEAALERGRALNDSTMIAYAAAPLGDALASLDRLDEAIVAYELAIDTFAEIDEESQAGVNALSMGELHGIQRRQTRALECFIRAYNLFQSCGDAFGAARAKDRMASALVELGDTDQALMHLKDALEVFDFLEEPAMVAQMNYRIGWTRNFAEKYLQADKPLRLAIQEFRDNQDWSRAALAETQLAMSLIYRDLEEPNEEAEGMLDRVAAYFEAAGEQVNVLIVESISADRLMIAGLYEEAASLWQDILARAIQYEDKAAVNCARVNLAECLFELGELSKGQEVFADVNASDWGENKPELDRIENVKKVMLQKMDGTLNLGLLSGSSSSSGEVARD